MRFDKRHALTLVAIVGVTLLLSHAIPAIAQEYGKQKICAVCHQKDQGQSPAVTASWEATKHATAEGEGPRYSVNGEPGVGCQGCHGPGQDHVKAKPEEKPTSIGNPADIETREGKLSLCGRCHGQYAEGFVEGYVWGENILDKITLSEPTGGKHEQLNEMKDSLHFTSPTGPTCLDCHTGHKGLDPALAPQLLKSINELCMGCHDPAKGQKKCDKEVPADGSCATCHMPNKKHIFKIPAA